MNKEDEHKVAPLVDVDALGQVIDTTWGRSSTPHTATHSVKLTINDVDRLVAKYLSIVTYVPGMTTLESQRRWENEAKSVLDAALKRVKESYKGITGSTLKLKEVMVDDSVEIVGMNVYTPKKTAYYRRTVTYEMG